MMSQIYRRGFPLYSHTGTLEGVHSLQAYIHLRRDPLLNTTVIQIKRAHRVTIHMRKCSVCSQPAQNVPMDLQTLWMSQWSPGYTQCGAH